MDKDKEYPDKVTEETISFFDSMSEVFGMMEEFTPEEDRELWRGAFAEAKEGIAKAQEDLRNATPEQKEKLAERKPPALWKLEKTMYNRHAEELGIDPIEEYEQEEDGSRADDEEEGT
jgi:hypothetical protein